MFQRARNEEQIYQRQKVILDVAEGIYLREGLAGLTLTAISKETSITRQALYRYYRTKEEVLLDLLKGQYQSFVERVSGALDLNQNLTEETFAAFLTEEILRSPLLSRLFSILYAIIEVNVAYERLVDFKRMVFDSFDVINQGLKMVWNHPEQERMVLFDYQFLVYLSSIHPLTHPTEEQEKAMAEISPDFKTVSSYSLCYEGLLALLLQFRPK